VKVRNGRPSVAVSSVEGVDRAGHCDRRHATAWAEYRRRKGEQTIYDRAQQDAGFRKALLTEAMNA
jgi:hypothetical protein